MKTEGQIVAERVNAWAKATGLMGSWSYTLLPLIMDLTPEEARHAKMCVGIMASIEMEIMVIRPENSVIISSVY